MSQHQPEVFAQARDVVARIRQALKPPPRLTLSAWSDAHFYLSPESSAEPGRWRTLPYQREPMDAMTDVHVEQVTFMKSARVGWTKMITALVGYHVEHDPCPILLIQPDEDSAKGHVKDEIEPMLRDVPEVGARFVTYRNRAEPMLHKRFRGGVLQTVGARSPSNFRRVSRRVIMGDEVDGYPPSAGKEGDPIKLAQRRSEYFWNRKWVWGSTPTFAGVSRIEGLFFAGDQRRYYVPCPHCLKKQVLQFRNMKWPKGEPERAVFVCIDCGCEIEHKDKRWMVERGEWRPGPHPQFPDDPKPAPFNGHASFHIWAAYSYSPNATWGAIAQEFVEAKHDGVEKMQTVVNTLLGETWKDKGEAPAWRRIYDRRESYACACPAGVRFLTAGVDVQRDGFFYEVVGWGRNKESWSIEARFIGGDPSDRTATGPWSQLDDLLDRSFTHEGGAEIRIGRMAIDAGDQTQAVYDWVRTKKGRGVMAIKGSDSASVLVGTPSKVDVTIDGKRAGHVRLWPVGKTIGIKELYGWLGLQLPTDSERANGAPTPPGYCHFPGHDERYFQQLTALQLVTRTNRQGFHIQEWQILHGREDHFLDARRYARAAAWVFGLDRFKEPEWEKLEAALGRLARQQVEIATKAAAAVAETPDTSDRPDTPSAPAPASPRVARPRRRAPSRSKYLGRE